MIRASLIASSAIFLVLSIESVEAQTSTEEYTYDALGRLIVVDTTGGNSDDEVHTICYDDAGNRTDYVATSDGSVATCAGVGAPPPPPPPPSSNQPPIATDDTVSTLCGTTTIENIVSNDTDPDGNYPLSLVSVTWVSGSAATATVYNSTSVQVVANDKGSSHYTYVVQDALGATANGNLTARGTGSIFYCGGI